MVYHNNFIVAVKNKGKILRESNGSVILPFGSEYSLVLKNKDSFRRALVSIRIDGSDVLEGSKLIIDSSSSDELLGFMKNGVVTNKFRFIEKTEAISKYRGNRLEDGLVEVDFQFEKPPSNKYNWTFLPYNVSYGDRYSSTFVSYTCETSYSSSKSSLSHTNDSGITVPGSETKQNFVTDSVGILESEKHHIIINLKGVNRHNKNITKAVTTSDKIKCSTCGFKWKSNLKYCGNCGTNLNF